MCPVCWTTALAAWAFIGSVTVLGALRTDRTAATIAASLLIASLVRWQGGLLHAWWIFASLGALLILRVAILAWWSIQSHGPALWRHALAVAYARCPKMHAKTSLRFFKDRHQRPEYSVDPHSNS